MEKIAENLPQWKLYGIVYKNMHFSNDKRMGKTHKTFPFQVRMMLYNITQVMQRSTCEIHACVCINYIQLLICVRLQMLNKKESSYTKSSVI